MPRRKPTFNEITETLTSDAGLSIKDRALFHYFNPRGAVAIKRAADQAISDAVARGALKSGVIWAYGSLNSYGPDRLAKLAMQARPARFNVDYAIKWTQDATDKARAAIANATPAQ